MIKAILKNHRQSPRKIRLVADLVRGKKVDQALSTLSVLTKKASDPVESVIRLAVANAKHNFNMANPEKLVVKDIRVDEGTTLRRFMPRARGSAYPIKKRASHITVELVPEKRKVSTAVAADGDEVSDDHDSADRSHLAEEHQHKEG